MHNSEAELLEHLLKYYSFELDGHTVEHCVVQWRDRYPDHWLRPAIVEALYQGRYKAVSVAQILDMWCRRGQSLCHYNGEFERMICNKFLARTFSEAAPEANPKVNRRTASAAALSPQPSQSDAAGLADDGTTHVGPSSQPAGDRLSDTSRETSSNVPSSVSAASPTTPFNADEPQVSLLDDDFLEVFAAEAESDETHTIAPFKPSAKVPSATSRFSHNAMPSQNQGLASGEASPPLALENPIHQFTPPTTTSDLYSKLKAALNRVVSATTDDR